MAWKKLGLVFCPDRNFEWMQTHASCSIAEHLKDDIFRIYFSTRNVNNISSVGYVDIDINRPNVILNLSDTPVLSPGELGAFDNDGISIACIVNNKETRYLYYLGWSLCKTVPFYNSIGLAISKPGLPFERYSRAPIMGRDTHDPLILSYPWVIQDEGKWKMWYGSHLQWGDPAAREIFFHTLKYAESEDGINWTRSNKFIIPLNRLQGEYAVTKPCVLKEDGIYKMWYAYRGDKYKIGYSESKDGIDWLRKDAEAYIDVSPASWDSESIAYPSVFKHKNRKYMLYTGNDYGRMGFGIAVWIERSIL